MTEKGKAVFTPLPTICSNIREICSELIRALEDGRTTSELTEVVHCQTRELARIFHQLSHLHSEKEGDN
jgi:hypothetical protein